MTRSAKTYSDPFYLRLSAANFLPAYMRAVHGRDARDTIQRNISWGRAVLFLYLKEAGRALDFAVISNGIFYVLVGILGLGLIIGGSIALKVAAEFNEAAVVFFMVLSFATIGCVELLLMRQLSR